MSTVERLDEAVRLTDVSAYGVRFPDLIVRYGEVVVLTGPNGSGKSTISRVLVGELTAAGTTSVLGADPRTADLKGRIGFLVKDLETMGSLTSRDVFDICAAVRDCGTAYAHELAELLELDLDQPMSELSKGQLRRLGIVQALMHEPQVVVLDDPGTLLDRVMRQEAVPLLRTAAARGAAVLMTVQSLADAEPFADRIIELRLETDHDDTARDLEADPASVLCGTEPCDADRPGPLERRRLRRTGSAALRSGRPGQLEGAAHPGHRAGRGDDSSTPRWTAGVVLPDPTGHDQLPRPSGRTAARHGALEGAGSARPG